jgi:hypothetical protein
MPVRLVATCALLLVLAGCGGGPVGTQLSPVPAPPPGTAADAGRDAGATPGNPVDAADLCPFLQESLPVLQGVGSPVGALAQFAGRLATWVQEHPDQNPRTAADLDEAAQAGCPAVHAEVVAALGADSFAEAMRG